MNKQTPYTATARGPTDHDLRSQIVTAATEHFKLYGYEKTTVSDLAKQIGFSKAYIYKFFESKQEIGEAVCGNCLSAIEEELLTSFTDVTSASDKLRRLFKVVVEASLRLFFADRKLYDIVAASAGENWRPTLAYRDRLLQIIEGIVREGREAGEFERKTPFDESVKAIYLVLRPYSNPLLLQYSFDVIEEAPTILSGIVLRSLAP